MFEDFFPFWSIHTLGFPALHRCQETWIIRHIYLPLRKSLNEKKTTTLLDLCIMKLEFDLVPEHCQSIPWWVFQKSTQLRALTYFQEKKDLGSKEVTKWSHWRTPKRKKRENTPLNHYISIESSMWNSQGSPWLSTNWLISIEN